MRPSHILSEYVRLWLRAMAWPRNRGTVSLQSYVRDAARAVCHKPPVRSGSLYYFDFEFSLMTTESVFVSDGIFSDSDIHHDFPNLVGSLNGYV